MKRIGGFLIFLLTVVFILSTSYQNHYNLLAQESTNTEMTDQINTNDYTQRIAGKNRYETSRMISEVYHNEKLQNLILVSANDMAGAISASPLASKLQAPVLLFGGDLVLTDFLQYIKSRMDQGGTIYMIGNDNDFPLNLEESLKKGFTLTRIEGQNSYDINLKLAQALNAPEGTPVFLANSQDYADAVSVSGIAGYNGHPILFVDQEISSNTRQFLHELNPKMIYLIGGKGSIPFHVEKEIIQILPEAQTLRIAGINRFETSIEVAKTFISEPSQIILTTGYNLADSMSATALASKNNSPIILLDTQKIDPPLAVDLYLHELFLSGKKPRLTVLGGNRVISNTLMRTIEEIVHEGYKTDQLLSYAERKLNPSVELAPPRSNNVETILISAVGDCTLGTDPRYAYYGSLPEAYDLHGPKYFFSGVLDVLGQDDLTIANLETPLTNEVTLADKSYQSKPYWFNGDPTYANILNQGSIEAVCIANNHSKDFREKGYEDTKDILRHADITYFGNGTQAIIEKKGVKIGLLGFNLIGLNPSPSLEEMKNEVETSVKAIRGQVDFLVTSFHWGTENYYGVTSIQKELGHFTIDSGADLVLGHHPHVLEPIEMYKGKYIVYSLGNFVFGGNFNPGDKDTIIFQLPLEIINGEYWNPLEPNVIPAKISSVNYKNDYRPMVVPESSYADYSRILSKVRWN